ncbi:2-polyprenyl-3-methyl-6-methoxy-1,4-benzoquinone monooxygenase [Francisella noatunensis]
MRKLSFLDRVVEEIDSYARFTKQPLNPNRKSPSDDTVDGQLSDNDKKHAAGLMRVDYTGEICAQGLYRGQASVAKSAQTKEHLYHAADEEYDHLAWCAERLEELGAKPTLLILLVLGIIWNKGQLRPQSSDSLSYGFVVETEKQVMKHMDSHLKNLPVNDNR